MLRSSILIASLIGTVVLAAADARAEDCVDRRKLAPGDTGRPCWDIGTTFGRIESFVTPGRNGFRIDSRVTGPRFLVMTNGRTIDDPRPRTAIGIESGVWEVLNLGDGDYKFLHAAGVRYQRDRDLVGYYVGGFVVTKWHDSYRFVTPTAGVRLGRFEKAAVVAEAKFPGLFLYSRCSQCRTLTKNFDVSVKGTLAVRRYLRLEGRARVRNITIADEMRQTDVMLAAGVEGAVSDKLGFRVMPTFIGLGVRYVSSHDEWKYHPVRERNEFLPVESRGFEVMLLVDMDFGINSSSRVW